MRTEFVRNRIWVGLISALLAVALFSVTAFGADYPTPTYSPDPAATATASPSPTPSPRETLKPVPTSALPLHLSGALSLYYTKYLVSTTFTGGVYYDDNGVLVSDTTRNWRLTDYITVTDAVKMIALRSNSTNRFVTIRDIAFFDADKNVLASHYLPDGVYHFEDIPEGTAFLRLALWTVNSPAVANSLYRVALSPSVVRWDSSKLDFDVAFWRDEIHDFSRTVDENGNIAFGVYGSAAFDELYFEVTYSNTFISCTSVSCSIASFYNTSGSAQSIPVEYNARDARESVYWAFFTPFYFDGGERVFDASDSTLTRNPFTASVILTSNKFSGFACTIPVFKPDGLAAGDNLTVYVNDFVIDSLPVIVDRITGDTGTALDSLADSLAVPQPSFSVSNIYNTAINGADMGAAGQIFGLFWQNELFLQMLLLTVTFALVGYIFFGKRGEE